jgi:hypothetical protein
MPPRSRNSTLVAFEADASRVVDPDSVAPFDGMRMLVVGVEGAVHKTPGAKSADVGVPSPVAMS